MNKRKICVVVASRANYGRVKSVMQAIREHSELELQLIVGASALLDRFGNAVKVIENDGFIVDRKLYYIVEGETLITQAKSTGMGIIELSTAFSELKPDVVVTVADRFETMSTAIAASYMNIPLAHIQGGEVSGNIDDRVRHAITKMSDIHFPATELSRERVIKMGENPDFVFNHGCPAMDVLHKDQLVMNNSILKQETGVGKRIDWEKPYILMIQHPVTSSYGMGFEQVKQTLEALNQLQIQKVVLWPNVDAGSDDVSKGIRVFRENNMDANFHYYKNFSPEVFGRILNSAACVVGNSSSFIREASYLGVPAVMVGDRQENREHGKNVVFATYNSDDILQKINIQISKGHLEPDHLFGKGDAGKRIANTLANVQIGIPKKVMY
jgi:UDP-hydrolysing UDP-N-acetyl-D-glucosamine 2-epimerase